MMSGFWNLAESLPIAERRVFKRWKQLLTVSFGLLLKLVRSSLYWAVWSVFRMSAKVTCLKSSVNEMSHGSLDECKLVIIEDGSDHDLEVGS